MDVVSKLKYHGIYSTSLIEEITRFWLRRSRILILVDGAIQVLPTPPATTPNEFVVSSAFGISNVISAMRDPGNWRVGALVLGLDEVTGAGLRLGCILLLAAVCGDPLVAQLAAGVYVEDAVNNTVDAEVGNGLLAAVAAAEGGAGDDCHGTEDVCYDQYDGSKYQR